MPAKATTIVLDDDAVRTRAYLMWEADGRPFGRDDHYWGLAVAELGTAAAAALKPKRAAAATRTAEKVAKPKVAAKKNAAARKPPAAKKPAAKAKKK